MSIRPEAPADVAAIAELVRRAFDGHPHSDGSEPGIVDGLRADRALSVALVAEVDRRVGGYVATSPVRIAGRASSWHGLGPVAVEPALQRRGLGGALVQAALAQLRAAGAGGCVVLGEPAYYGRFGFAPLPGLVYPGPPAEYFMALAFGDTVVQGEVSYHAAFGGAR